MDAALAMTASHGGSAIVVGKAGRLKGIFTDGDFRRVVAAGSHDRQPVLQAPVARYMTAKPSFVRDSAYAAELLKVFARKRIDDLPVVDARGRVVGLVDLQDLPKMKVL